MRRPLGFTGFGADPRSLGTPLSRQPSAGSLATISAPRVSDLSGRPMKYTVMRVSRGWIVRNDETTVDEFQTEDQALQCAREAVFAAGGGIIVLKRDALLGSVHGFGPQKTERRRPAARRRS
jgi:hypothetical protein